MGVNLKIISLAGAVVASWSLTQEVTGANHFYCSDKYFVTELAEFSKTFRKLNCDFGNA